MKTCFKCNVYKPLSEFYKHSMMVGGYLNKCKSCNKADSTKHRNANIEKVREYDRERSKHPHRIELNKEQTKMWRSADRRRGYCHNLVSRAIKSGELSRLPCSKCGKAKSLAHHESYDEPLNVVWLCQPCHKQRHKEIKELK
jgi:hypothetical protein